MYELQPFVLIAEKREISRYRMFDFAILAKDGAGD